MTEKRIVVMGHPSCVIPKEKIEQFKNDAIANAKSHDAEYWRKSRELTSRKLDFDRIDRL